MDEPTFQTLLPRIENESLDFKATAYDLTTEDQNFALIKDVLCMVNTPRDDSAYIILGVKKHPDGKYDLLGVNSHIDDADLQAQFAQRVFPLPRVSYHPFESGGKTFGVIEMPPERVGPCVPTKDYKNFLRERQVYVRRGSRNDVATPEDLHRLIEWLHMPAHTATVSLTSIQDEGNLWKRFFESIHEFEPGRRYVLLAAFGDSQIPKTASSLGQVDWNFVLDWDPKSESAGLLRVCKAAIGQRRNLRLIVGGDRPVLDVARATSWFFPRGLEGRQETLAMGPWRVWNQRYGNELREQLSRFARASNPSPVTVLALWYDRTLTDHLNSTLEAFLSCLGDSVDIVVTCDDPAAIQSVTAKFGAVVVPVPLTHLCAGFEAIAASQRGLAMEPGRLPSSSGAPVVMDEADARWIEQEIEVVTLSAGRSSPPNRQVGRDFLKGADVDWYELGLHYDVDRETARGLADRIDTDLRKRTATRINLYHAPGAGGSTVARRLLWDFHFKYPCGILHRTDPSQTAERLYRLVQITKHPMLLMVDGSEISEREVDGLFDHLRARHLPVVCVQVLRRFGKQKEGERSFNLSSELTHTEASNFAHILSREVPERRGALEQLTTSTDPRERSAFFFGLQAFGKDFLGLEPYVGQRIRALNSLHRQVLVFLAIAHRYSQKPLPSQAFSSLLEIPHRIKLDFAQLMPDAALDLLVLTPGGRWRTAHDLIAVEILEQLLSPSLRDRRTWKQNLSTWAKEFASFCRGDDVVPSDEMLEVARRAFVYRDNVDLLGTERAGSKRFSQLLEEIPSEEGALEVLRELVKLYPDEAHFWAHLGRYLSSKRNDHVEAKRCLSQAVALNDKDHVLHHMMGMAIRHEVYSLLEEGKSFVECIPLVKEASGSFEKARQLDPEDEHGHISDVQMLIRVLDHAGRQTAGGLHILMASPTTDPFLREAFQHAEDMLEFVRRNREGEGPSPFEEDCRARLHALYGRFDQALRTWNGLLSRDDVYAPPMRRQIVWTYLSRQTTSWDGLSPAETKRVVDLLEDNLREEPNEERNLRLWLQAVRRLSPPPTIEAVLEKTAYWKANTGSIEAVYYLYVLNSLLVLDGSSIAADPASRALEECRFRSKLRRNRTKSYEWVGRGKGLSQLVHHSRLGNWRRDIDFWQHTSPLARVQGRISAIAGPEAGEIECKGALRAFFVPAKGRFSKERSLNLLVDFYLGFSYDGLRAWDVKEIA